MGNLEIDSAVRRLSDNCYRAELSPDWEVWGPNGGYLAAVVLRAAGACTTLDAATSLSCHFLGVADFGPVDLRVTPLRSSRRAESLRISMSQEGKPVLESIVWCASETGDGPERSWIPRPVSPGPEELEPLAIPAEARVPFWRNIEVRPSALSGRAEQPWEQPRVLGWSRLRPQPIFPDDKWLETGRLAVFADSCQFPAVAQAFLGEAFVAPSLDLYVAFHDTAPEAEWLLGEGRGLAARHGLAAAQARIWSPEGRLLATARQQMRLKPIPA